MSDILVFSIVVLIYIFIGYPLLLGVLSVFFGKKVRKKDGFCPYVSLLISAYNEEAVIRQKLENSLALDYPEGRLEIIVASESSDKTNEMVMEYKEKGVVLYGYEGREGKRATLYRTVPLARGEIIVFSDANAMYEKDALRKLVRNFFDPTIGCVSGRLRYVNPGESASGRGETAYWEFDFILKMLGSRLFSLGGGVNGSIFAIRKELYNPIDRYRGDDFELSCRVEIDGYGAVMEPEAVSYEESLRSSRQEFKRKVRLATWNLRSSLMLLAGALKRGRLLTAFILFSHRFLRYTTPVWLIMLFLSNAFLLNGWFSYLFFLQVLFYSLGVLGMFMENNSSRMSPLLLVPFYFCMLNLAALVGMARNLSGKTEMFWEKAR